MIANYHTHTYRCGHAEGDVGEYAEQAEKAGLRTLGIADHTPYDFFDIGPRNHPMRMALEEFPGYMDSLRALETEYRGRLEIIPGVEAEYYPKYFPRLLELLRSGGVRYMILGQHFLGNEVAYKIYKVQGQSVDDLYEQLVELYKELNDGELDPEEEEELKAFRDELQNMIILELKADGICVFTYEEESVELNWKVEGETITLAANGEEMTGTIKDGVIALDVNGETIELKK